MREHCLPLCPSFVVSCVPISEFLIQSKVSLVLECHKEHLFTGQARLTLTLYVFHEGSI